MMEEVEVRRKIREMKYVETLKLSFIFLLYCCKYPLLERSAHALQRGIAEEVLRFHVLANSDSAVDQAVKLEVRDAVLAWLEEAQIERSVTQGKKETANTGTENDSSFMSGLESEKNTKEKEEEFLRAHLTELEAVANNVLASKGQSYQAHAELTTCYFPERTYGACTFPSGWYQAFRIKLGKAKDTTGGASFIPVCVYRQPSCSCKGRGNAAALRCPHRSRIRQSAA